MCRVHGGMNNLLFFIDCPWPRVVHPSGTDALVIITIIIIIINCIIIPPCITLQGISEIASRDEITKDY